LEKNYGKVRRDRIKTEKFGIQSLLTARKEITTTV
jgi:hypothetical protein